MPTTLHDDITLELARLQREALANIRRKIASQQLGEAWVGLDISPAAGAVVHFEDRHISIPIMCRR